ncbi:MAG: DsbA family protein, partial [Rhizobiales bacterium]|nr:DsbA family protein [Hyphomicrobiales bacterium]
AAQIAGLDMARAESDAASQAVSTEIARNLEYARSLGFTGTPAWVAGAKPMGGMVGFERLKAALAEGTAG